MTLTRDGATRWSHGSKSLYAYGCHRVEDAVQDRWAQGPNDRQRALRVATRTRQRVNASVAKLVARPEDLISRACGPYSRTELVHGPGSRNKLSPSHARYYADDSLLDTLGRAICAVDCLPRKELHEAWEMATRIHTWLADDTVVRVVDLCAGYGLLAQVLLLQGNDPRATALAVDVRPAKNYVLVHDAIVAAFPNLAGRVTFERAAPRGRHARHR